MILLCPSCSKSAVDYDDRGDEFSCSECHNYFLTGTLNYIKLKKQLNKHQSIPENTSLHCLYCKEQRVVLHKDIPKPYYECLACLKVSLQGTREYNKLEQQSLTTEKAKSDKVSCGLTMVPMYSVMEVGKIFVEGLRYGKDNWKKGVNDKEYQEERLAHALEHLFKWKEGDRSEQHLAKVAWFCLTQLELERLENE